MGEGAVTSGSFVFDGFEQACQEHPPVGYSMPSAQDGDPGADRAFTLTDLGGNLVLPDALYEHLRNTQVRWGEFGMERCFNFEGRVEDEQLCLDILEFYVAQRSSDIQVEEGDLGRSGVAEEAHRELRACRDAVRVWISGGCLALCPDDQFSGWGGPAPRRVAPPGSGLPAFVAAEQAIDFDLAEPALFSPFSGEIGR